MASALTPEQKALSDALKRQTEIVKRFTDQHYEVLQNYRRSLTKEEHRYKTYEAKLQQLEDKAVSAKKRQLNAEQKLADVHKNILQSSEKYQDRLSRLGITHIRSAEELKDAMTTIRREMEEATAKGLGAKAKELGEVFEDLKRQAEELEASEKEHKNSLDDLANAEREHAKELNGFTKALKQGKDKLVAWALAFTTGGAIWSATKGVYATVQKLAQSGIILEENVTTAAGAFNKLIAEPIKLGLTPDEYTDLVMANRQAVNALGGTAKAYEGVKQVVEGTLPGMSSQMRQLTLTMGGTGQASKYLYEQMGVLGRAGIKPTVQSADHLQKSMLTLRHTVGMTGAEYNAMLNDLSEDEGIRARLRSESDEKQRLAILKNTAGLIANYTALGMTKENAIAAAKALNKIAGEKAVDRMTKAAKFQAMSAALGIDRDTARKAALFMTSPKRYAQYEKEYANVRMQASRQMTNVQGTGSPREYQLQAMMDQLGLGDELGIQSAEASQKTADATKLTAEQMAKMNDAQKELPATMKGVQTMLERVSQVSAALNNSTIALMVGLAGAVVGMGWSTYMGTLKGSAAGTAMGKAASRGLDIDLSEPGSKKRGGGGKWGKLATGAKWGGAALGGALSAYQGYQIYNETGKTGEAVGTAGGGIAGGLAGAKMGALAGGAIGAAFGGVGAVPGAAIGGLVGGGLGAWGGSAAGGSLGSTFDQTDKTKAEEKSDEGLSQLTKISSSSEKSSTVLEKIADASTKQLELSKQIVTAIVVGNEKNMDSIDIAKRVADLKTKSASFNYV